MKHIPTLTLTALAAAASAQTAPAAAPAAAAKQELSYNRVIVSVVQGHSGVEDGNAIQAQAKLGSALGGTLYVSASSVNFDNDATENTTDGASLGYAYSLSSIAGITSDLNVELGANDLSIGVRALVASGIELGVAYTATEASQDDALTVSANYSLSQFVKGLTINASHQSNTGAGEEVTLLGLGYNF